VKRHRLLVVAVSLACTGTTVVACSTAGPTSSQNNDAADPNDASDAATPDAVDWDVVGADAGYYCFVGGPNVPHYCDAGQFIECEVPETPDGYLAPVLDNCTEISLFMFELAPPANFFFCCE
jgi:hypothetical protein